MKKAGILLTILLFSMLTAFLTIIPPVIAQTLDPQEMNSGMGRPYQDLIGVNASSDGINLTVIIWLAGAPPKADGDSHVEIMLAIDTDNETNSGESYFPDYIDAVVGPTTGPDGPGGGHYYWEYCVDLRRWTNPALRLLYLEGNSTAAGTIGVTNSSADFANALSSPYTVNMTIPLATIGNPTHVTLSIITTERQGTITPTVDYPPPTNFAHVARDTIGDVACPMIGNPEYDDWGQWIEIEPAIIGLLTSAGSSDSASDPTGDFAVLPCNDVTKVEVEQGQGSAIINVTMASMTNIWGRFWMFTSRWQLVIAIDTDGIPGSGQAWIPGTPGYGAGWEPGLADVRIDPAVSDTYWEKAIVIGSLTDIHLYDTNFNDLGAMGITTTEGTHSIKIEIPVGTLGLVMPQRLNLTVLSGQDWYNLVNDVVGTWSHEYNSAVNTQGYYLVRTSIPPTEEILPIWPGGKVPTPPSVIGRPYQDIREVWAKSDGTNLNVSVTLDQAPPKRDNETHVNIYVAIDNGTTGGSWQFPDNIDAGYTENTDLWEYCLALYNWTTPGAQYVNLTTIEEYVSPPGTPSWTRIDALAQGVTVTNSSDGKTVNVTIPLVAIGSPSTVNIGVVTSEDLAKVRDTVGSGYVRTSLSQWVEVTPAITGLSTSADSDSKSDPAGDFVGKSFWDITGVAVEEEYGWILVNVTFQNLTNIVWSMDQWGLAIGIDTDHVAGSGQDWMAFIGPGDARIDESINDAYWERCVVLDEIDDIHVYNTAFGDLGSSGTWAELIEAQNTVRVHIPSWNLPPSPDLKLKLTVISGMDGGNTVYDAYGTYAYAYSSENTQGFYNLTTAFVTGPVMYSLPLPTETFNTAMGRPYQDITGVWAKADGTNLNVSVTLREAPPKADAEDHVNIYVALDTADGGQDWFPDEIDARYNITDPEHHWEYCLVLYSWTGASQSVDLVDMVWTTTDALSNPIGNVTVTNSTDGKTVNVTIPLTLIDSPSNVTIGVVTSEGDSKIKDTVGSGPAIILGPQWIHVEPAIIDLLNTSVPKSKTDPEKDFCGKSFWDITNVVVDLDYADVIVDVTFLNVSGLSTSWEQWWMTIDIDTDHVLGSGDAWIYAPAAGSDTRFVNESVSEWELCAIINSPTDITFYNVTGTYPNEDAHWVTPPHGVTAELIEAQNKIRVVIPKSWLKLHTWTYYNLTVTVVSGVDAGNRVYDIYGSYDYGYPPEYGVEADGVFGFYVAYTHPSLNYTGPYKAELSMLNGKLDIFTVNVDLDHWFSGLDADADVVVRWLTYIFEQQTNQTIWTNTTLPPWRATKLQNITHPLDHCTTPVEVVELVLVSGGEEIILARFTVSRPVLMARLGMLDYLWTVPGADRSAIMKEYVHIDGQWPYAPP